METYQKIICRIINLFLKYTNRLDNETKRVALTVSCILLTCSAMLYSCVITGVHLLIKCIIGTIICMMIIFFSIEDEVEPVKWNKIIAYLWFGFGAIRLLSGIITSLEYLPLALIWIIVFPTIFLIWNNRGDYSTLVDCLYKGIVYPVVFLILVSILTVKVSSIGYGGVTGNANSLGQYISVAFPLLLIKYNQDNQEKKKRIIWIIEFALLCTAAFFSKSRTTALVIIFTLIAFTIYQYIVNEKKVKDFFVGLAKIFFVTIFFFICSIQINTIVAGYINYEPTELINVSSVNKDEGVKAIVSGYVDRIEGNDKKAEGADNYSSGRMGIWKEASRKINLIGHPSREHIVTDRNGDVGNNVHNTFLQFAYDHGIIGGILFVILYISAFLYAIIMTKRSKDIEGVIYIHIAYGITAMLSSVNLPFLYIISFVYYMSYIPIFSCFIKKVDI